MGNRETQWETKEYECTACVGLQDRRVVEAMREKLLPTRCELRGEAAMHRGHAMRNAAQRLRLLFPKRVFVLTASLRLRADFDAESCEKPDVWYAMRFVRNFGYDR